MKVLWERPIAKASRLLGVDDNAVYLGGAEFSALDLKTRQAPVGDARSQRQHGRHGPGAAGRPLATDAARHLRDRPQVGHGPADLSRQRPGRRSGATCSLTDDVAAGRLQSHDLRLSPPAAADRDLRPRRLRHLPRSRLDMNKPAIAVIVPVDLVLPARSARAGLSSSTRARLERGQGEHRGLHRRRQGLRRRQAEPGRDRPRGLRRLGADRRRDRQVPRRQAADPRGIRRAQARQRRGRGARPAGRPEGADAEPLLLRTIQPNTRTKTEVQLTRKLVVKASDIRKMDEDGAAAARRQAARRRPGRRRQGRAAEQFQSLLLLSLRHEPQRRAWSASSSTTSTSSRRKPTRRRSPTRGRGPSGWRG